MATRRRLAAAIGTFVLATMVLGACAPNTGTPIPATAARLSPATPAPATVAPVSNTPAATSFAQAVLPKSKDPTTLTYLQPDSDAYTLDPAYDYEAVGESIIQNTYDTLIFYNRDDANSFVPQLATEVPSQANGGISPDGRTYTFKIRSGVKFHNGDTFTPGDVAFTFQRGLLQGGLNSPEWLLFQPILGLAATPSGNNDITDLVDPSGKLLDDRSELVKADPAKLLAACQMVVGAVVGDDAAHTLTFHLAQSWGPFLATLAGTWGSISDQKWIGANGGWDGDCHTWQNFYNPAARDIRELDRLGIGSRENGTGPYLLDHSTPSREVVLKAFDGYWRTNPVWPGGPSGAPRLKTIVMKTVIQPAARLAAMQSGDADFVDTTSVAGLDSLVGETCEGAGNCMTTGSPSNPLRVFNSLPAAGRNDVFFNFKIDTTGGNDFIGSGQLDGNGIPPDFFTDAHVRKAFNYCFNWAAYIKDALGGGTQAIDVMLPGEIGYSEQDPHYSYDPARCKSEFMASALKATDGRSLWDTGFRLSMPYSPGNDARQPAAQILSQDIRAVNPRFVVEVTGLPDETFVRALNSHKLPIYVNGWLEDIHDPQDWLAPYVSGYLGGLQSLPADLVMTLTRLSGQAAVETDVAKRAAIYKLFNQAYYDAAPDILLAVANQRHYEQRWVQGYYGNPLYDTFYFYALSKQ